MYQLGIIQYQLNIGKYFKYRLNISKYQLNIGLNM